MSSINILMPQYKLYMYNKGIFVILEGKLTIVDIRAATVQIFFGSVSIFDVGFRLFRFCSSNCILFVFHVQNMYS